MEKRLRTLVGYHAGDEYVSSVTRIPSTDTEDRRYLHRDCWTLSSEYNQRINRVRGSLAPQGIRLSINSDLPEGLEQARTRDGPPLSPDLKKRFPRKHKRMQLSQQGR